MPSHPLDPHTWNDAARYVFAGLFRKFGDIAGKSLGFAGMATGPSPKCRREANAPGWSSFLALVPNSA